jgi:3-methyladenine DNA glycosylase AlkD
MVTMDVSRAWSKAVRKDIAALARCNVASVRAVRRRYSRALKSEPAEDVLHFVRALLADGDWPARLVACETLESHKAAMRLLNNDLAEEMAQGLSDWGSVDLLGVTVLGQAWREGLVSDAMIEAWSRSPDRWRRRLALVATVPLNSRARGGYGDARRTLRVCRILLNDRDDMVVKAMSWALRELAKRDPKAVKLFVEKEHAQLAARVRREVRNKLTTGLKGLPRKRATKVDARVANHADVSPDLVRRI